MLLIYYSLQTAGIETFFTRLAEERKKRQLKTKILLFDVKNSSPDMVRRIEKSAEIIDLKELLVSPLKAIINLLPKVPGSFSIVLELNMFKKEKLISLLSDVNSIHVTSPMNLHFSFRLMKISGIVVPVSAGFYHSDTFGFESKQVKQYYYKQNLFSLAYEILPKQNLVAFNDKYPEIYKKRYNIDLNGINLFPLGVINNSSSLKKTVLNTNGPLRSETKKITICSVGRIVDFKTYNYWMLDVIKELTEEGFSIEYDIYGEGEMKSKCQKKAERLQLNSVSFKGILPYGSFRSTVQKYDLFIGSGTAIVEAAALGVPSIVGIERIKEPLTYGYLSDVPGYTYNEEGVKELVPVKILIERFSQMDMNEVKALQTKNFEKAKEFSLIRCSDNFEKLEKKAGIVNPSSFNYSRLRYVTSFLIAYYLNSEKRS